MSPSSSTLEPETKAHSANRPEIRYESWGRFPRVSHQRAEKVYWRDQLPAVLKRAGSGQLLPYGMGRSYGDSCLNEGRTLLDCTPLNRILDFDWNTGRVRVEAGLTLADLLEVIVPHGWFLPVTPGTRFVTIGGAIANDVHGKNHHRAGTFGCHVDQVMLYRSDAEPLVCSQSNEPGLFAATIGGLGLTGVIGWADIRLRQVSGNTIAVNTCAFEGFDEFLALSTQSDQNFEHTVGWLDCFSGSRIRGIFFRGNHANESVFSKRRTYTVPFPLPEFVLNRATISAFNTAYYHLNARKTGRSLVHYEKFFYPLDSVSNWNLLYGRRGFVQFQCVVPYEQDAAIREMLAIVSKSKQGSFLGVLKVFGDKISPALLSFPRRGLTLALDFPMRGQKTIDLLDILSDLTLKVGGAIYPAKDSQMSPAMFQGSFPKLRDFEHYVDPAFSSSLWRRVTGA